MSCSGEDACFAILRCSGEDACFAILRSNPAISHPKMLAHQSRLPPRFKVISITPGYSIVVSWCRLTLFQLAAVRTEEHSSIFSLDFKLDKRDNLALSHQHLTGSLIENTLIIPHVNFESIRHCVCEYAAGFAVDCLR